LQLANWSQLPKEIDRRIAQGIEGINRKAESGEYKSNAMALDINRPEGYYTNWNNALVSGHPISTRYNYYDTSRVEVIENYIKNKIKKKEKICKEDMTKILHLVSVTYMGNQVSHIPPSDIDPQNGSYDGYKYYKEIIQDAVTAHPSYIRRSFIDILKNYDSKLTESTSYKSKNISEDWYMFNTFLSVMSYKILYNELDGVMTIPMPTEIEPLTLNRKYESLLLRIVTASNKKKCSKIKAINEVYNNWTQGIPILQIITEAIDETMKLLGNNRGEGKRPVYNYISKTLGIISMWPILNRATVYTITEYKEKNVEMSHVMVGGNSGTIVFKIGIPTPDKHLKDQDKKYNTISLYDGKKIEIDYDCEKKADRYKYCYEDI